LRLDFKMTMTVGSSTETVLAFQQLLSVDASGTVAGEKFAFAPYTLALAGAAAQAGKEGRVPPTRSALPAFNGSGLHPLVTLAQKSGATTIAVDAEFVDATMLFWDVHAAADQWRWYLHPSLGGRADNLRVLAWTAGGRPMLWFVAVTDAAKATLDPPGTRQGADLVFFRPPPGANSFGYALSKSGFSDSKHADTTVHILARYLLTPCATSLVPTLQAHKVQFAEEIAEVMASATSPVPNDPMERVSALWTVFQPVGLESAIARTEQPHVLFLPLGSDVNDPGGYDGAMLPGLKTSIGGALALLWNTGGIARDATALPSFGARALWLAGHSAGNGALSTAAKNNGADVERMISVDATGTFNLKGSVIPAITTAAAARAAAGKPQLEAMVVASPHVFDTPIFTPNATAPTKIDFKVVDASMFASTKAKVGLLPDLVAEPAYWQIEVAPALKMNPYLRRLLSSWSDAQVIASAKQPSLKRTNTFDWFFLFFHEYAIFGGHLDGGRVRTFFEDALGAVTPAAAVTVIVRDKLGAPAAGATVTVVGPMQQTRVTDASGSAVFGLLEPGAYTVRALTSDEFAGTGTANAAVGTPATVTVQAAVFSPKTI
jgi:hypothetical protein